MDGEVTIKVGLDTKDFRSQIAKVESDLDTLEQEYQALSKASPYANQKEDLLDYASKIEKTRNQLNSLYKKQSQIDRQGLSNIQSNLDNIGSSVEKTIKKVGKMALAVFGLRSAYLAVRKAASTLAQYNEQIGADLEYIQFALASALQPIVEGLINLVYRLLTYVNYLAQAWFGVNIFANATAKNMKKVSGSAKEMKKSLAGFDEMSVLSDSSSAGGGVSSPSVDLSGMQGEVPEWIKWLGENGKLIEDLLLGIAAGIVAIKLGADLLQATGIGLIFAGLLVTIQGLVAFIKDPSWNNFLTILEGISLVIAGIGLLTGNWITALIALGAAIVLCVIQNWDKVKEVLGKVGSWIYDHIIAPVGNFFSTLWNGLATGASNVWNAIKNVFSPVGNFFSGIWNTIKSKFTTIGAKIGDAVGGAFKNVINSVLKAVENILNSPIRAINSLIKVINKVPGINLSRLDTFNLPRLAVGGVINMPGKGVYTGGAIAGERGAEGVIPLTNSQMMAQLGEAIGKHININLTNITKLDKREIAKEQKKINQQQDFAFNR